MIIYSLVNSGDEGLTFNQLIEKTGFTSSHITQQTDKLAKIGIIRKKVDAGDTRRRLVTIGNNGIARLAVDMCLLLKESACAEEISNLYYLSKRAQSIDD